MSHTLDDLRSALADPAGGRPDTDTAVADRMAGIRARVAARRRRRAGALSAAVAVVAIVAVAGTTTILGRQHAAAPAAPRNPMVNGLALYAHGGRQIGSAQVPVHAGLNHLFSATPTSYRLDLALACSGGDLPGGLTVRVNGEDTVGTAQGKCSDSPGESTSANGGYTDAAQQRYWSGVGVRPGRSTTVDVFVTGAPPAGTTVRVALYQDVPLADYPFPGRPATLQIDPDFGLSLTQSHEVTLPGSAATGRWSRRVPYDPRLELGGVLTAPGLVELRVNGVLVGGQASWDYSPAAFQLSIRADDLRQAGLLVPTAGTPVTVTVTLSRFAERTWRLRLGRSTNGGLQVG